MGFDAGDVPGGDTTLTTAQPAWDNVTWAINGWNTSPSLATVLAELHASNDLAANDHIVIWLRGATTAAKDIEVEAYDKASSNEPTLTIVYTSGAPAGLSIPIAMHHYKQIMGVG